MICVVSEGQYEGRRDGAMGMLSCMGVLHYHKQAGRTERILN